MEQGLNLPLQIKESPLKCKLFKGNISQYSDLTLWLPEQEMGQENPRTTVTVSTLLRKPCCPRCKKLWQDQISHSLLTVYVKYMNDPTTSHRMFVKQMLKISQRHYKSWSWIRQKWQNIHERHMSSTRGYSIFYGSSFVSWSSQKHATVSRSSTEVEYKFFTHLATEITRIDYILYDLGIQVTCTSTIWCDNRGSTQVDDNLLQHNRQIYRDKYTILPGQDN